MTAEYMVDAALAGPFRTVREHTGWNARPSLQDRLIPAN